MTRRHDPALRCPRCRVHVPLCFCSELPSLETRTRVLLVVHRDELKKPTNTGLLAVGCLRRGEVLVRGHEAEGPEALPEVTGRGLLLFPAPEATPLDELVPMAGEVTLVVPDGTWRQAARVRKRVPGATGLTCVSLPRGAPSAYKLRAPVHPEGVSTLEAIARALGMIEGREIERALLSAQRLLVERTLRARGLSWG